MKKLIPFIPFLLVCGLAVVILFVALNSDPAPEKHPHEIISKKIVKGKNQSEETSYKYKYNIWRGRFYHQPDIHSVYYLVYTDGSYDQVDVGKFTITSVGDTVIKKSISYY